MKRGITELVTPGVAINDNVLSYKENNFLAADIQENNGRSDRNRRRADKSG